MILKLADILTTIYQSILLVWICNSIVKSEYRFSRRKSSLLISIISIVVIAFTYSNIHVPFANLFLVIGSLFIILTFYRKDKQQALLGFSLGYSFSVVISYVLFTVYKGIIVNLNLNMSQELSLVVFIFVPAWCAYCLFLIFSRKIINFIVQLRAFDNLTTFLLIINYAIIVLDTVKIYFNEEVQFVYNSVFFTLLLTVFLFVIIYFAFISHKAKQIEALNKDLNEKIVELRKIKHDYGSEISSLYGLYKMGKIDKLGRLLKAIIDRNQGVNTALDLSEDMNPIVAATFSLIDTSNINLVVEDNGDYEKLLLTENEMIKLISNIIRNSIDAIEDMSNPIIKYKSYNSLNNVNIEISNNGPEIPSKIINSIFQTGFSTKTKDSQSRGYGLSIVKDIVLKHHGDITVASDEKWTTFKITIPFLDGGEGFEKIN